MAMHYSSRWMKQLSPERTKVWVEPKPPKNIINRDITIKVPVVYYLSRNGHHLDHPHFIEVSLSSSSSWRRGLFLKDVIARLNALRGKGMGNLYSWSSKRSYKNGFVWHDLGEDDFIHPAHGNEYVLKGSSILNLPSSSPSSPSPRSQHSASSSSSSSISIEHRVCKSRAIADASTQTDDRTRIPNPSNEKSMAVGSEDRDRRIKSSAVLMQLVSCGSIAVKGNGGFGSVGERATRGGLDPERMEMDGEIGGRRMYMFEEKEYFSGSLIETTRKRAEDGPGDLMPSNSYNADRSSKLKGAKRMEGARAKCIPRKSKAGDGHSNGGHGTKSLQSRPTRN